tara:strand:+ start:659 stop:835 length:177 start_codon:yes stop_codon:yes gene_type:complete
VPGGYIPTKENGRYNGMYIRRRERNGKCQWITKEIYQRARGRKDIIVLMKREFRSCII